MLFGFFVSSRALLVQNASFLTPLYLGKKYAHRKRIVKHISKLHFRPPKKQTFLSSKISNWLPPPSPGVASDLGVTAARPTTVSFRVTECTDFARWRHTEALPQSPGVTGAARGREKAGQSLDHGLLVLGLLLLLWGGVEVKLSPTPCPRKCVREAKHGDAASTS